MEELIHLEVRFDLFVVVRLRRIADSFDPNFISVDQVRFMEIVEEVSEGAGVTHGGIEQHAPQVVIFHLYETIEATFRKMPESPCH